jgi:hypothetical protein
VEMQRAVQRHLRRNPFFTGREVLLNGNSMGKFTHDLLSPKGSLSDTLLFLSHGTRTLSLRGLCHVYTHALYPFSPSNLASVL